MEEGQRRLTIIDPGSRLLPALAPLIRRYSVYGRQSEQCTATISKSRRLYLLSCQARLSSTITDAEHRQRHTGVKH